MPDKAISQARTAGTMIERDTEPAHAERATITTITVGSGRGLTLSQVEAVARGGAQVAIAPTARERVRSGRGLIERIGAEDRTVYGVTTGFGHLSSVRSRRTTSLACSATSSAATPVVSANLSIFPPPAVSACCTK